MILGITGGSGAGKTTLLQAVRQRGFLVLDCDQIYHELLETDKALLEAIENRFPGTVEAGRLQRKKLGALVFSDPAALEALNAITHGAIRREVERRLLPENNAAIDAIALFESGLNALCDVTVAVVAPEEDRVRRLMDREGITEAYARSRIAAQPGEDRYRQWCDYVIENSGDLQQFQEECLAFFAQTGIM